MVVLAAFAGLVACPAWAQAPSNPNLNARLLVGARENDLAAVERALAQGAAPESRNRLGKTALLIAAERGNLGMVSALLKAGADVNTASLERVTPLIAASYKGAADVIKRLIDAGARTDPIDRMKNPRSCTPPARARRRRLTRCSVPGWA